MIWFGWFYDQSTIVDYLIPNSDRVDAVVWMHYMDAS